MNEHEFKTRLAALLHQQERGTVALFAGFGVAFLHEDTVVFRHIHSNVIGDELDLGALWDENAEQLAAWLNEPDYAEGFIVSGDSKGQ